MPNSDDRLRFLLLKDFKPKGVDGSLDDLRRQLKALPDFEQVELAPNGCSDVVASVPASKYG